MQLQLFNSSQNVDSEPVKVGKTFFLSLTNEPSSSTYIRYLLGYDPRNPAAGVVLGRGELFQSEVGRSLVLELLQLQSAQHSPQDLALHFQQVLDQVGMAGGEPFGSLFYCPGPGGDGQGQSIFHWMTYEDHGNVQTPPACVWVRGLGEPTNDIARSVMRSSGDAVYADFCLPGDVLLVADGGFAGLENAIIETTLGICKLFLDILRALGLLETFLGKVNLATILIQLARILLNYRRRLLAPSMLLVVYRRK